MAIAFVFAISLILGSLYNRNIKKFNKETDMMPGTNRKKRKNDMLYVMYLGAVSNVFIRRFIYKIQKRIEILYPSDSRAVANRTMKFALISSGFSLAVVLVIIIIGNPSIYFVCLSCYGVYVTYSQVITILLEKQEKKLLIQLSQLLNEIRHNYHCNNSMVVEAVEASIDKVPYEISLHASRIVDILNSSNIEEEIANYNEIAPNKFLMTLLAICKTTMQFGDKKLNDTSIFLQNINYLKQEVNIEILKKKKISYLFGGLSFIATLPIFAQKPLEAWCRSSMEGIDKYFDGKFGMIASISAFASSIIIYELLTRLREDTNLRATEHYYLERLLKIQWIRNSINREICRKYSHHSKISETLKFIGETINPMQLLLKRCIYFVCGLISCIVMFGFLVHNEHYNIVNHVTIESSYIENEEEKKQLCNLSTEYIQEYLGRTDLTNEDMLTIIKQDKKVRALNLQELVSKTVVNQIQSYDTVYFKWYYILISVLVAIGFFNIPYLMISFKKKVLRMSMTDEVLQFQTIILMLMHIGRVDISIILEWMERFSNVFKRSLNDCINNYDKDGVDALLALRENEPFVPFAHLVDNLISCESDGVAAAFAEIAEDRSFNQEDRRQDTDFAIQNKSNLGKLICMLPMFVIIALSLIAPFVVTAIEQFGTINTMLNSL